MAKVPDFQRRRCKQMAEELLRAFGITKPDHIDVQGIAARLNIDVIPGGLVGAVARLTLANGRGIIRLNHSNTVSNRIRFSIAHELGHHQLHVRHLMLACDENALRAFHSEAGLEYQANIFAGFLLMPDAFLARYEVATSVSWKSIQEVATDFQVSREAAAIRSVEASREACALVCCSTTGVRWSVNSSSWQGRLARRPAPAAQVWSVLRARTQPPRPKEHDDLSIWFDDDFTPSAESLTESAIPMYKTGSDALVLLHLDNLRDEEDVDDDSGEDDMPRF
jgi:Zn-dependent peptidase ImmA (M78 family)